MGLDQNLIRFERTTNANVTFNSNDGEEIAYWRKANQIHEWMNKNLTEVAVENCEGYPITKEQLEELRQVCVNVYTHQNEKYSQEHLPTTTGFFYGSDEYDDWYYNQVNNTIELIDKVLQSTDFNRQQIFYWAWW